MLFSSSCCLWLAVVFVWSRVVSALSFLVLVLSLSCLFFALSALRLSSSSCLGLGLFFNISSGLVVLCLLSCLVLYCLALVSVLVLSYRCCVGLSVVLRCVFVVLGRFVDSFLDVLDRLGGRCWPFWVVLGGSWGRFGSSFGRLARS